MVGFGQSLLANSNKVWEYNFLIEVHFFIQKLYQIVIKQTKL
jgi:hypothetical protein